MSKAYSFFATSTPEPKPVEGQVLYSENLHIKWLLKRLITALVATLIPIMVLVMYGIVAAMATNVTVPGFTNSFTFTGLPALNPLLVVLILILWYAGCVFAIWRSYFEWRHTVVELTMHELAVYRPRNILLLLRGPESDIIRAASVVGFHTESPTVSELFIFRNCITASVTISEIEGNKHSPVDLMTDIRNYKALESAVKTLSSQRAFVIGG